MYRMGYEWDMFGEIMAYMHRNLDDMRLPMSFSGSKKYLAPCIPRVAKGNRRRRNLYVYIYISQLYPY